MNTLRITFLLAVCGAMFCAAAQAAPSLPVTKPPVISGANPNTGPDNDPAAVQGQWFIARQSPLPLPGARIGSTVRPYEFHDNALPMGGGPQSFLAIQSGNVTYLDTNLVAGFDTFNIDAIITNDLPGTPASFLGTNSHGETRGPSELYLGTMFDVKLTASFAVDINNLFPLGALTPPYFSPGSIVYQATNHDELAWYCFNNDPVGNFWVPTWDFGNIPIGQSATRTLTFYVGEPALMPGGPLDMWLQGPGDKFWNRTDSLKISDWVSPDFGPGIAYDFDMKEGSNVSVFHNVPEPASCLGLVVLAAFGALRRRN